MARTRIKTLERRLIVFSVLALIALGVVLFRPSTVTGVSRGDLAPLIPDFARDSVRSIELTQGDKKVTLNRKGAYWVLPERFGYKATPGAAAKLIDEVADAREVAVVTRREKTFAKYTAINGWIELRMRDAGGTTLADLKVGRADGDDVFVLLDRKEGPQVVRAFGLRPRTATVDNSNWVQTDLWPEGLKATAMVRIDIVQRDAKQPVQLVKRGASSEKLGLAVPDKDPDNADKLWWMNSPRAVDADTFKVQDLARAITSLKAEDVVGRTASDADDAKFGFDQPEVRVKFWDETDGAFKTFELVIGKRDEAGDAWFVRRGDTPWVYAVPNGGGINNLREDPATLIAAPTGD